MLSSLELNLYLLIVRISSPENTCILLLNNNLQSCEYI